jgi:hypothetical protein
MESGLNLKKPILRRERQSDKNIFPDNFIFDINNWIVKRGTIHSIEDILYHINLFFNSAIDEGKIDHFNEEEKKKLKECLTSLTNISHTLFHLPNTI